MTSEIFKDKIVLKPWGYEYLLYATPSVELWYLRIEPDQRTSMHCHPTKKTGLVVLKGRGTISFLNDEVELDSLSKVMIRPGLFHSTQATSPRGLSLLEIETPPDKNDLVRMEDRYGRTNRPYEGAEAYRPDLGQVRLDQHDRPYVIDKCQLLVTRPGPEFRARYCDLVMVLDGGLVDPNTGKFVMSPGDVVGHKTFNLLRQKFESKNLEILVLS